MTSTTDRYLAAERCVSWLAGRVHADDSGSEDRESETDPRGRFWLGRLAPAPEIAVSELGVRAERLEPCAVGVRFLVELGAGPPVVEFEARFSVWRRHEHSPRWRKTGPLQVSARVAVNPDSGEPTAVRRPFEEAFGALEGTGLAAYVRMSTVPRADGRIEVEAELVNDSDHESPRVDDVARGRLFECAPRGRASRTVHYLLESLPDSFR